MLARWTGKIRIDSAGTYEFTCHGNDEIALFVDGEPVASASIGSSNGVGTGSMELSAGLHYVTVNYVRWGGQASQRKAHSDCYADRYADLKAAFGYDHGRLLDHWGRYGMREGRKYHCDADWARIYIAKQGASSSKQLLTAASGLCQSALLDRLGNVDDSLSDKVYLFCKWYDAAGSAALRAT